MVKLTDDYMYMTNQLKIISVNCQGLGDKRKCQDVLMNLKLKKYNVEKYLLLKNCEFEKFERHLENIIERI